MANGSTPAGWYQDPTGQGDARYWNGSAWTESVSRGGQRSTAPIDPAAAQEAPVPGTEMQAPATPAAEPEPQRSSGGTSTGVIIGLLVAALVVVVLIAVALVNDDDSDSDPEPPTTTEAGLDIDIGPSSTAAPTETG